MIAASSPFALGGVLKARQVAFEMFAGRVDGRSLDVIGEQRSRTLARAIEIVEAVFGLSREIDRDCEQQSFKSHPSAGFVQNHFGETSKIVLDPLDVVFCCHSLSLIKFTPCGAERRAALQEGAAA